MLYRSLFSRDAFSEFERLQRELERGLNSTSSIRGFSRGGYPAINIGTTPNSVELYVFVPGVAPEAIDLHLEKGVLTISGERASSLPAPDAAATAHIEERFHGRFRRVVSLPDDIDPNAVQAKCRDGVLQISIQRVALAQPRRIAIQ